MTTANPRTAAPAPSALCAANETYDRIDDIRQPVAALQAIEQLVTPWKLGSQEDLCEVNRTSMAWLLALVCAELRRTVDEAQRNAQATCEHLRTSKGAGA